MDLCSAVLPSPVVALRGRLGRLGEAVLACQRMGSPSLGQRAFPQLVALKFPHTLGGSGHVLAGMQAADAQIWQRMFFIVVGRRRVGLGARHLDTPDICC